MKAEFSQIASYHSSHLIDGFLSPCWVAWRYRGAKPWVLEVLRWVTRPLLSQLFHCCWFRFLCQVLPLPSGEYTLGRVRDGDCLRSCCASSSFSKFYCRLFVGCASFSVIVGFVISLQVCSSDSFSGGITSFCPSCCHEVRLVDLNWPLGCVSPGFLSSWQSQFLRYAVAGLSFSFKICASISCVHQGHVSRVSHVPQLER